MTQGNIYPKYHHHHRFYNVGWWLGVKRDRYSYYWYGAQHGY